MALDTDILKKDDRNASILLSTIGVIIPFAFSVPVSWLLYTQEYAMKSRYSIILYYTICYVDIKVKQFCEFYVIRRIDNGNISPAGISKNIG